MADLVLLLGLSLVALFLCWVLAALGTRDWRSSVAAGGLLLALAAMFAAVARHAVECGGLLALLEDECR